MLANRFKLCISLLTQLNALHLTAIKNKGATFRILIGNLKRTTKLVIQHIKVRSQSPLPPINTVIIALKRLYYKTSFLLTFTNRNMIVPNETIWIICMTNF